MQQCRVRLRLRVRVGVGVRVHVGVRVRVNIYSKRNSANNCEPARNLWQLCGGGHVGSQTFRMQIKNHANKLDIATADSPREREREPFGWGRNNGKSCSGSRGVSRCNIHDVMMSRWDLDFSCLTSHYLNLAKLGLAQLQHTPTLLTRLCLWL